MIRDFEIVRRRGPRPSFRPALEALEIRLTPSTFTWTGAANTNWNNMGNWSPGDVPGASDVAQFGPLLPGASLPIVNASETISQLVIGPNGFKTWDGVAGQLTIAAGKTLTLSGANTSDWSGGASIAIKSGGKLELTLAAKLIMDGSSTVNTNLVEGGSGDQGAVYVHGAAELDLVGSGNVTVPIGVGQNTDGSTDSAGGTLTVKPADGNYFMFGSTTDDSSIAVCGIGASLDLVQPASPTAVSGMGGNSGSSVNLFGGYFNVMPSAIPTSTVEIRLLPLYIDQTAGGTANLEGYDSFTSYTSSHNVIDQYAGTVTVFPWTQSGVTFYGSTLSCYNDASAVFRVTGTGNVAFVGSNGSLISDAIDMNFADQPSNGYLLLGGETGFVSLNVVGTLSLGDVDVKTFMNGSVLGPMASGSTITATSISSAGTVFYVDSSTWGAGVTAPFQMMYSTSGTISVTDPSVQTLDDGWNPIGGWEYQTSSPYFLISTLAVGFDPGHGGA